MTLTTKFDEGDIVECLDLAADEKRRLKILAIMGWGAFNGFQYKCLEVDKDGNSFYTPEIYDDGDFDRQFVIYKVEKAIKDKKPKMVNAIDFIDNIKKALGIIVDDTDKKGKGGKQK